VPKGRHLWKNKKSWRHSILVRSWLQLGVFYTRMQIKMSEARAEQLTSPRVILATSVGMILGTLLLSLVRSGYYLVADVRTEMSPMMFVVFAPVVAAILLVPTLLAELLICHFWQRPLNFRQAIMIGSSYPVFLLGLIEPWLLVLVLAINSITLRLWFIRLNSKS
jgi:hypothetical protein